MKKFLALVMVGVMTFGMASMAKVDSPSTPVILEETEVTTITQEYATFEEQQAALLGMSVNAYKGGYVEQGKLAVGFKQGIKKEGIAMNYSLLLRPSNPGVNTFMKNWCAANNKTHVFNAFCPNNPSKGGVEATMVGTGLEAGVAYQVYQYNEGTMSACPTVSRGDKLVNLDVVIGPGSEFLIAK